MRGAYEAARSDTRETMAWTPSLGSADEMTLGDLRALRARSYDAERNQPVAGGALLTMVDNVVGFGLTPTPEIDAEFLGLSDDEASAWEDQAARIVRAVTETTQFDVAGRNTFSQLQRLAFRSVLSGGDVAVVRRYRPRVGDLLALKLQLVEADRIGNPPGQRNSHLLRDGVVLDEFGCPTGLWIASRFPHEAGLGESVTEYTFVPMRGPHSGEAMALHVMEQLRPHQSRGVPALAPVLRQLKQIDRSIDAELAATVLASFFTVFIKGTGVDGTDRTLADMEADDDMRDLLVGDNVKLSQGGIVELPDGKDITIANPGRPNAQLEAFLNAMAQYSGAGLGIPRELLIKVFNSSYSASRAAMAEAWRMFEGKQEWLTSGFCQPVYEWIIIEAIERGLLLAPGFAENPFIRRAYLGATWTGPTMTQLDPVKEVNAAIRRIDAGLSSRAIEAPQLTGKHWKLLHRQLVKERNARVKDGLAPQEIITSGGGSMILADDNETPAKNNDGDTDVP